MSGPPAPRGKHREEVPGWTHTKLKKFLGGVAAAIALTFVAAPASHAAKPSSDDTSQVQGGTKTPKKDSGWG